MPAPTGEHPSSLVRGPPTKEEVETPWHWLLAMSSRRAKPPPKRRPRTSCPGGRAQVAQGCATTRVRTGRPVEGCALPPGHGGPVRSWHEPVTALQGASTITELLGLPEAFCLAPGVAGPTVGASCSDAGAPGPQARGFSPCARGWRAPRPGLFALMPELPGPEGGAFGFNVGAPRLQSQGVLPCARSCRAPRAGVFGPAPRLPSPNRKAFCLAPGAAGLRDRGFLLQRLGSRAPPAGLTPTSGAPARRAGIPAAGE